MGVAGWRFMHSKRTTRVAGQPRQPAQRRQACSKCGCIAGYTPALETLNGKNHRLVRCAICRSLSWFDEPPQ